MALSRLRRPCAPCAASSSARSFMPCPVCARTCWILTSAPSARSCARAFLLRATSAPCLRDAGPGACRCAEIASCESESRRTAYTPPVAEAPARLTFERVVQPCQRRLEWKSLKPTVYMYHTCGHQCSPFVFVCAVELLSILVILTVYHQLDGRWRFS